MKYLVVANVHFLSEDEIYGSETYELEAGSSDPTVFNVPFLVKSEESVYNDGRIDFRREVETLEIIPLPVEGETRLLTVKVEFEEDAEIEDEDKGLEGSYPIGFISSGDDGTDAGRALDEFHSTFALKNLDYVQTTVLDGEIVIEEDEDYNPYSYMSRPTLEGAINIVREALCAYAESGIASDKQAQAELDASWQKILDSLPPEEPGLWKVERKDVSGWEDADWTVDDKPQRFNSEAEAIAEIDEFIADQHEAVNAGNMDDKYDRNDYRPVKA